MNKIAIVAKREFLTRVQKKTFLLTTILLPLLIFSFYGLIIYFVSGNDEKYTIAVADEANLFKNKLKSNSTISFSEVPGAIKDSLNTWIRNEKYNGYIYIPAGVTVQSLSSIEVITEETLGIEGRSDIQDLIDDALNEERLLAQHINPSLIDSARQKSTINFQNIDGADQSNSKFEASLAVGYIGGFLIYIILFIYGTMVMRGVMEEKVSRIAEVIVSSVKPFELMMGKITGIGAVGLIQFLIWILIVMGLNAIVVQFFPDLLTAMQNQPVQPGVIAAGSAMQQVEANGGLSILSSLNLPLILGCFVFYFLGGYLLYSALFAAVGSAVNEDPQDAQSLLLPITMPIIFGIVILIKASSEPYSGIAVFGSLFPLTSPIVMMARIAHGIPDGVTVWELILSMALLIAGFICTTWLAGKIYRTGILMYGKKITWKEMWKWALKKS